MLEFTSFIHHPSIQSHTQAPFRLILGHECLHAVLFNFPKVDFQAYLKSFIFISTPMMFLQVNQAVGVGTGKYLQKQQECHCPPRSFAVLHGKRCKIKQTNQTKLPHSLRQNAGASRLDWILSPRSRRRRRALFQ